ncbi:MULTISPECIES: GNAT family N-acetyltransferase [Variovorax]|jgi:GNAT superfamily N-acetyltransferase|uniref:GNAT family N-acetyltransferase n=1 Tax=Variovorax TaxID=34072 RepID=UPI0008693A65|nr:MULTISPECIES: GNAT family N-acetyltransferase [Variovorax]MBN8758336.1 GNAT family N-acetyltransferase [Variovorax sp.]ODU12648.1 MAG: GNAT family N-acetyltransferase [Variovorax sp. SCN 67-85]ODV19233.1 MAG: GNAT family N-acetyltransferase [Variovorax sp. SCN 67-20]OJZ06544.1 MAG: GNAT family N-acetyltransferase [Variovorax sp. 67-131]UKI07655.1 GNAT family N-acetyltransferase [Variovorax paradoxus]
MTTTSSSLLIRPPVAQDYAAWRPLWDGYNAFYGREGPTALPDEITQVTWRRFFDAYEPVHALVAERDGQLVGLTHYLFHRSTNRIEPTCYLQDLFTLPSERGRGVGRQLIHGVYERAKQAGGHRVYWQTHVTNTAGRTLYDKVASHDGFIVYGTLV